MEQPDFVGATAAAQDGSGGPPLSSPSGTLADAASDRPDGGAAAGNPRRLGDYELIGELGRGGMGVVYRARQRSLNRLVAVKVLIGGSFAGPTFLRRFRREAESVASLHHPNIVAIHQVGEHDGHAYFAMELIGGRSLAERVRERPMSHREAASLVRTVADAVQYAHERRILHRDLKPSNLLIDENGNPHITDFGAAKRMVTETFSGTGTKGLGTGMGATPAFPDDAGEEAGAGQDLTLMGQLVGTPNYMAPEQADPALGPVTPSSDVYSLGAILYELLTGRPPFVGETLGQTLQLVTGAEVVSPRTLNPGVDRDLETLCLKCLEKHPRHRFASALELADELGRFLRGEPIRSRPLGWAARMLRWCRREPALASSLVLGTVLFLGLAILSPIALFRIDEARRKEAMLRERAERAEQVIEERLWLALHEQARATILSGEMGQRTRALDALRRAAALSNSLELRREALAALVLPDVAFECQLPYGGDYLVQQLDPGFEHIALGTGTGPVEVRRVVGNELIASLPASTNLPVYVAQWSPNGRWIAVKRDHPGGGRRADWEIWDVGARQRLALFPGVPRDAVAFHPSREAVLVGDHEGAATLWELRGGAAAKSGVIPVMGPPAMMRYSRDGNRVALLEESKGEWVVSIHDAESGRRITSRPFQAFVGAFRWHPSGRWLIVCDDGGNVAAMDATTGELRTLGRHKAEARVAEFTQDGEFLFTGAWGAELLCWDIRAWRRAFRIDADSYRPQLRIDDQRLALVTTTGISIYRFVRPLGRRNFGEDLGAKLQYAAFSPDGRWLMASGNRRMGLWDLTQEGLPAWDDRAYDARGFFAPDSRELYASRSRSGGDNAGFRWRIGPGARQGGAPTMDRLPLGLPDDFSSLCVAGKTLVVNGDSRTEATSLDPAAPAVVSLARTGTGVTVGSPDGRWLGVFPHFSPILQIYHLPSLSPAGQIQLSTSPEGIKSVEFSPGRGEVALYGARGVEFWNTGTWEWLRTATNRSDPFLYAPGDRSAWMSRGRRESGLFDATSFKPHLLLPTQVLPLAVSPDGRFLAIAVEGQQLQVLDLKTLREELRALGLDWTGD